MKKYLPLSIIVFVVPLNALAEVISCTSGFTNRQVEVGEDQINDGYCDCPLDGGRDELETGACSGSSSWAGAGLENRESHEGLDNYACPRQPNLLLPPSRIHDGICDCCDGSDETANICEDFCGVILAKERAERDELVRKFNQGSSKRIAAVQKFQRIYRKKRVEIEMIRKEQIPALESAMGKKKQLVIEKKEEFLTNHLKSVKDILENVFRHNVIIPSSVENMTEFLAAVCQIHGEITHDNLPEKSKGNNAHVCKPIILAGMDLGILWVFAGGETKIRVDDDSVVRSDIADRLLGGVDLFSEVSNGKINTDTKEKEWVDPEDAFVDKEDDYFHNDNEHRMDTDFDDYNYDTNANPINDISKKEDTVVMKLSKFARIMRGPFLKQAKGMINDMNSILENSSADDKIFDDNDDDVSSPSLDPMAFQMNINNLSRKVERIEYGNELGMSAVALLQLLEEAKNSDKLYHDLANLAVMTVYHALLSLPDVIEIFTVIHADIDADLDADLDICYSPYTKLCNGAAFDFTSGDQIVTVPPEGLEKIVGDRCLTRSINAHGCSNNDNTSLPLSNIPDGIFNYFESKSRPDGDFYTQSFKVYQDTRLQNSIFESFMDSISTTQHQIKELKSKLDETVKEFGKKNDSKYGPSGELYEFRDECWDILAGKYIYEVCLFGDARQRDNGAKKGGTNLGKWKSISIDKETGTRELKW
eukprot:CAMPEP_0194092834 /NCGR_PEP_ID=MMETSP0149-20130528/48178_1 /TAXON_ID=122233 /ORGANISM="Chaetoceros debilis, Strain MM31A-1" /LENGTH=703 /DNA_ID=CAMNT_0038777913 /DNA_START=81 /DNA_END=2189 /DNA_ORIENTATION=+